MASNNDANNNNNVNNGNPLPAPLPLGDPDMGHAAQQILPWPRTFDFVNGLCRFWNSEWIVERSGISTRRLHVFRYIVRAWMDATVATQDNLLDSIKLTADDLANAIIQGLQNQNQNEAISSITALNNDIQRYAPTSGPEHEGAKDIFRGHLPRLDNH